MKKTKPLLMFLLITVLTSFSCSKEDVSIHIQTDLSSSKIMEEPLDTVALRFLMEKKRWLMQHQATMGNNIP